MRETRDLGGLPAGRKTYASVTRQDSPLQELAATHECEELKNGVWLEPISAVL